MRPGAAAPGGPGTGDLLGRRIRLARTQEERINRYPQFTASIGGGDLHFFYQRGKSEDATPLLLLHGWPGSSTEFLPMLDALTDPPADQPAFEVIVPSLPGFGLGGPAAGWDAEWVAAGLAELMRGLGHTSNWVHGYDFGAIIAHKLAIAATEEVAMLHLTRVLQGEQLTRETAGPDDAVPALRAGTDRTGRVSTAGELDGFAAGALGAVQFTG